MRFKDHSLKLVYSDLEVFLVKEKQKQFLDPNKKPLEKVSIHYIPTF